MPSAEVTGLKSLEVLECAKLVGHFQGMYGTGLVEGEVGCRVSLRGKREERDPHSEIGSQITCDDAARPMRSEALFFTSSFHTDLTISMSSTER